MLSQQKDVFFEALSNDEFFARSGLVRTKALEIGLNAIYDASSFSDYGPIGLQVDRSTDKKPVKRIVTAVTASLETIEQAAKNNADALIVHHGIFWQGQSMVLKGSLYRRVRALLDMDMALLAYHLPMDAHMSLGNSAGLALDMGLENLQGFAMHKGHNLGVTGTIFENIDIIKAKIEKLLKREILVLGQGPKQIQNIAIVSGGGQREFSAAIDHGNIDLFITGEVSEQNFHLAKEEGLWFMAAGHHATERFGPRLLAEFLNQMNLFQEVQFMDVPNPV